MLVTIITVATPKVVGVNMQPPRQNSIALTGPCEPAITG
jgi:hypothetical protein